MTFREPSKPLVDQHFHPINWFTTRAARPKLPGWDHAQLRSNLGCFSAPRGDSSKLWYFERRKWHRIWNETIRKKTITKQNRETSGAASALFQMTVGNWVSSCQRRPVWPFSFFSGEPWGNPSKEGKIWETCGENGDGHDDHRSLGLPKNSTRSSQIPLVSIGQSSFSHEKIPSGDPKGSFPPSPGGGWKMHRSGKSASPWKEPPRVSFIQLGGWKNVDFMGDPKISENQMDDLGVALC